MDKKEAYELGLDRGKAIATDMDLLQGKSLSTDRLTNVDNLTALAHEIELTYRQFPPFDSTAHTFNTATDPDCDCNSPHCSNCEWYQDELWQRFESGINDGIESVLRERLGLTEEDTM